MTRTFVIAEAGVNHQGDFGTALKLIDAARFAGADAVKFQCFSAAALNRPELKPLEMSHAQLKDFAAYAKSIGIEFMCTAFGVPELEAILPLIKRVKIASGCLTNDELLHAAAATNLPILLSTGMSTMLQIDHAIDNLDNPDITLLHCVSAYPCPLAEANLQALNELRVYGDPVGYSDHTEGIIAPLAAVAMGAVVIEKHLTLDRLSAGPDHLSSIEPATFRVMVDGIRAVEMALGDGVKRPMPSEAPAMAFWR